LQRYATGILLTTHYYSLGKSQSSAQWAWGCFACRPHYCDSLAKSVPSAGMNGDIIVSVRGVSVVSPLVCYLVLLVARLQTFEIAVESDVHTWQATGAHMRIMRIASIVIAED